MVVVAVAFSGEEEDAEEEVTFDEAEAEETAEEAEENVELEEADDTD